MGKKGAWFTIVDDLKVLNDITAKTFQINQTLY